MERLDHALVVDDSELDPRQGVLDLSQDAATPVSWRMALLIWVTLSMLGWGVIIGIVLAVL